MGGDDLLAEFIQNDWRKADLTDKQRAMLEYAEKLTLTPAMMTEDDINALRDVGWTDRDVLDIVMACAYFNFRVRVVDGLGLEVSDMTAVNSVRARENAATLAAEKGVTLPSDIWGVRDQAEATSTGG